MNEQYKEINQLLERYATHAALRYLKNAEQWDKFYKSLKGKESKEDGQQGSTSPKEDNPTSKERFGLCD